MLSQLGVFYGRLLWLGIGAALLVVAVVSGVLIMRGTPVTVGPLVGALKVVGLIAAGYMAFSPGNRARYHAAALWQGAPIHEVAVRTDRAGRRKSTWYTGAVTLCCWGMAAVLQVWF